MTTLEEQFEGLYGPPCPFSDFAIGEHITYHQAGTICTGTILWVASPGQVPSQRLPTRYIVAPDHRRGVPDIVWQSDIIVVDPQEAGQDEPAMVTCPYCGGFHYADQVKLCPNNPNQDK